MLSSGGIIIDVRSNGEFYSGHIENSLNIPLSDLTSKIDQFNDKDQPIITCCASGRETGRGGGRRGRPDPGISGTAGSRSVSPRRLDNDRRKLEFRPPRYH